MAITIERIINKAVSEYEEEHPEREVSNEAARALLAQALPHRNRVLYDLRVGKTSQRRLTVGVKKVLARSAARRIIGMGRGIPGGPTSKWVILGEDVRAAMEKKCETFPWC